MTEKKQRIEARLKIVTIEFETLKKYALLCDADILNEKRKGSDCTSKQAERIKTEMKIITTSSEIASLNLSLKPINAELEYIQAQIAELIKITQPLFPLIQCQRGLEENGRLLARVSCNIRSKKHQMKGREFYQLPEEEKEKIKYDLLIEEFSHFFIKKRMSEYRKKFKSDWIALQLIEAEKKEVVSDNALKLRVAKSQGITIKEKQDDILTQCKKILIREYQRKTRSIENMVKIIEAALKIATHHAESSEKNQFIQIVLLVYTAFFMSLAGKINKRFNEKQQQLNEMKQLCKSLQKAQQIGSSRPIKLKLLNLVSVLNIMIFNQSNDLQHMPLIKKVSLRKQSAASPFYFGPHHQLSKKILSFISALLAVTSAIYVKGSRTQKPSPFTNTSSKYIPDCDLIAVGISPEQFNRLCIDYAVSAPFIKNQYMLEEQYFEKTSESAGGNIDITLKIDITLMPSEAKMVEQTLLTPFYQEIKNVSPNVFQYGSYITDENAQKRKELSIYNEDLLVMNDPNASFSTEALKKIQKQWTYLMKSATLAQKNGWRIDAKLSGYLAQLEMIISKYESETEVARSKCTRKMLGGSSDAELLKFVEKPSSRRDINSAAAGLWRAIQFSKSSKEEKRKLHSALETRINERY